MDRLKDIPMYALASTHQNTNDHTTFEHLCVSLSTSRPSGNFVNPGLLGHDSEPHRGSACGFSAFEREYHVSRQQFDSFYLFIYIHVYFLFQGNPFFCCRRVEGEKGGGIDKEEAKEGGEEGQKEAEHVAEGR